MHERKSGNKGLHVAHHSEEEGSLVGLQRGLWVKSFMSMVLPLGRYHRRSAQFLDELRGVILAAHACGGT